MFRTPAVAATVLTLIAGPVLAAETAKAPAPVAATPAAAAKASPQQRVEAGRLDPLARATFWAREMEIDGRDLEAAVGLSAALRQLGRFPEAADAAGRALVIDPNNVPALLEAARSQIGRGEGFYAIEPARKAQTLSPRDWRPVALLAVAMEQAGRDDEALAYHRQALALAPDESAVLSNLGMYYAGHGDFAQAEQMLRRAAAAPGADATVRQNLALVIGLQGRIGEAEALARRDLPPDQVANNVAWLKAATEAQPASTGRTWDTVKSGGGS